jgi:glycine cleavage system aminomethyltransferase T
VPAAGDRLLAATREIGVVTSAAVSPRFGTVALGYVHRDFVEPGTIVEIVHGDRRSPATVTPRPMPVS